MLAMVHALRTWKHYLMGSYTFIFTDSTFLKFLSTMKSPSPRVTRWLSELSLFHYEIQHIPGTTNTAADALSRLECLSGSLLPLQHLMESWDADYRSDPLIVAKYFDPYTGQLLDPTQWHDGRLWHDDRIVVPASQVANVISLYHDAMVAGHWGTPKTLDILQRKFLFPDMRQRIKEHIQTCHACQTNKAERKRRRGSLQPLYLQEGK